MKQHTLRLVITPFAVITNVAVITIFSTIIIVIITTITISDGRICFQPLVVSVRGISVDVRRGEKE